MESAHVSQQWIPALSPFPVSTDLSSPGDKDVPVHLTMERALVTLNSTLGARHYSVPWGDGSHQSPRCPHGAYTLEGETDNQPVKSQIM